MKNTFKLIVCLLFPLLANAQETKPNILLITLDDMNWDSPSSYGGIIPNLTPNIDAVAKKSVLFKNAYVQAPNCSPSRVVIQTGLYPHQSGMRGFYYVKNTINTVPELLKESGYFTGVINKTADTSLSPNFNDFWDTTLGFKKSEKRDAKSYGKQFSSFINERNKNKKPFYCVVNIADPHKPFFNDAGATKKELKEFKPSKVYTLDDVEVPAFLPNHKKVKQEVLNYYNSVRRGDDCVGYVLDVLKKAKLEENTIVVILSDHGMPFPFAKSTVYQNGVKTPLLISWPKKYIPRIDYNSIVSAIDLAPTFLDMAKLSVSKSMEGNSILPLLNQKKQQMGKYVFAQFDENAGGIPRPSRAVLTKKYGYVFNPWATGAYVFQSAATWHTSYKQMAKLAKVDDAVKQRFNFWKFRVVEEFYDYEKDPNALNNLIDNPNYKEIIDELKLQLSSQMKKTDDYVLNAFVNKADKTYLNTWMEDQVAEAKNRRESIKWKRGKNFSGSTKKNTILFDNTLD
ncbi:sulfatase family protein [Polaribacter sp.]|uniref:sulfatase family protein n=1 Tax=Polaribacter sp. TaxID=1920175 RepID=UPI003F6C0358